MVRGVELAWEPFSFAKSQLRGWQTWRIELSGEPAPHAVSVPRQLIRNVRRVTQIHCADDCRLVIGALNVGETTYARGLDWDAQCRRATGCSDWIAVGRLSTK